MSACWPSRARPRRAGSCATRGRRCIAARGGELRFDSRCGSATDGVRPTRHHFDLVDDPELLRPRGESGRAPHSPTRYTPRPRG
jgi:hypothetical protein